MFSLAQNYLTRGFWGDEAWTSLISQLPYVEMLKTTAADFHPPGYYSIIQLWYLIFPATEVSTRVVSIIFYLLTGFVVYKLVSLISTSEESTSQESKATWEVFKNKSFWGLVAAVVVLLNPIFFTYAFEARNYTMFAFMATGSMWAFLKLVFGHRVSGSGDQMSGVGYQVLWFILYIFFSTLGIYTHYYMFFTLAAQGIFVLLFYRQMIVKMAAAFALMGILYLPWMPFLLKQVGSVGQSYWIGGIDVRTHYEAILRILAGEHDNIFRFWLFGISLVLILAGLVGYVRKRGLGGNSYVLLWLWALVPFVFATIPGMRIDGVQLPFRPIFFWRYLIPAAVPLSILILQPLRALNGTLRTLIFVVLIGLSVAIDYLSFIRYPTTFKQVYANGVVPQIREQDKLVTVLPSFAEVLYYRNRNGLTNELVVLPEGLVQFSGKSLLDAYERMRTVKIAPRPESRYFELRPGPSIVKVESQSVK